MSVCLARNFYGLRVSLGWGARNPMGKIVRLIEGPDAQFAKNPERPWTQDFQGDGDALALVAELLLQPLAMKFHKGAAAQDDSVAQVTNLAP
jgi:hypothetical protein